MRITWMAAVFLSACAGNPEPAETSSTTQSVWTNGDFENDPINTSPPTGWTLNTYLNPTITDTRPNPQTLASLRLATGGVSTTKVVGGAPESQADPDIGATGTLRYPKYGNRAVVVNTGTAGANQNANSIKQQMTVGLGDVDPTDNKVHVRFAVAPVLENPGHAYTAQPYYFVRLQNLTTGVTLYQDFNASGQAGVPWKDFTDTSSQAAQYTDWQLVDISPGNASLAVGNQVELLVVAAGCSAGGHWGRVYVDAVGSGIPGLYTWATGAQQANAGTDLVYTINYKNGGTTTTNTTQLAFVTPPSTVYKSTTGASCTAPAAGATGTVSCGLSSLAPGATGSYTVTVTIPAATATGTVITNGNYSIYASGVSALVGPKVLTTVTNGTSYANVGVTMTDGIAAIGWGQADTYTIVVTNQGPLVTNATVADTMPSQLTGVSWTCAATGGGTCTASGSNNISDSVSLPVGATLTYTVRGTIQTGTGSASMVNTVTVTPTGAITDPDTTDNTAVDTDTIGTLRTLSISKLGTSSAGIVSSTPAAISCGATCSADFLDSSQVNLTATPVAGGTFVGWGGACSGTATTCSVTMAGAQSVTAQFAGAPAATVVSSGTPQAAKVSTAFASSLAVVVSDGSGNAVPGATVTFTAPASGASATFTGGVTTVTATTNSSGSASVSPTANATRGSYAVTAAISGVTPVASFALTNYGSPASVAVATGSPQSATVGTGFASLVAIVKDASSQPVPGAIVAFTAPTSGAFAKFTGGVTTLTATTDTNGLAALPATANTVAGTYSVTASTAGVATPASFALTNVAAAATTLVVAAGNGQSVAVDGTFAPLVAKALDTYNNPVAGVTVTFTRPATGATALLATPTGVTAADGTFSTAATAGTITGAYSVTATATGLAIIGFALTNTAGTPATIAVVTGTPQSATVNTAFATALSALVKDNHGNFVPNAAVTFAAPGTGASATVSSTTTDAFGVATTAAFAGTTAGAYTVTASITAGSVGFALTNLPGAAATVTVAQGGAQSTTVGTSFATQLKIVVVDTYGNPVPNAAVTIAGPSSGAGILAASGTTNTSGIALVTVTANHTSGTYSVTAASGSATSPASSLTNTAGTATQISIVSGDGQHAVVTHAFAQSLVVVAKDTWNNLVPNASVTFSAGANALFTPNPAITGATGQASTLPTAGAVAASYTVTAAIPGASATFSLVNDPGAPATVAIAGGNNQSAVVAARFAADLVVHVTDAQNNDVPNVSVTFSAPMTGATASLTTAAHTDATGRTTVTATANQITGSYSVTASVAGATSGAFSLRNTAGTVATLSATGGGGQEAVVLTPFPTALALHAADQYGNAVPGATVTFAASSATFADTGSEVTDASGDARILATAGAHAGSYSATATSGTGTTTFALTNLPGAATTIAVVDGTPQQAVVMTAFAAPIRALVTDAQANPVPGVTVTFATSGDAASATFSATTATTDTNGVVSVTATANRIAGNHDLLATISGASSVFHMTNLADVPASIAVDEGATPQQMTVGQPFAAPLLVTVRDRYGNLVPGATVTYGVPAAEPTASLAIATATTDVSGAASVFATAGIHTGAYVVTANVTGVTDPAAFSLTNTAGTPASLVVAAGDPQSAVVDTDFATPLAVLVLDANHNPVPSVVVQFQANGTAATASLATSSAQSDATGIARVGARASKVTGTFTVTASLSGAANPVNFNLTNTPGAAATITASSVSTPQNQQVAQAFVQPLVVRVADSFGNSVPGATVTYTAPTTGATGALGATSAITGNDGKASVAITAGTMAGAYAVTATTAALTPARFALANLPGTAQTLSVAAGDHQSATVATALAAPISVAVADSFGNAVPDALVEFATPSGATLGADSAITGADGTAQITLTAATLAGDFEVFATTPSGTAPVAFELTATPGAAAVVGVLAATTPQSAEILHAFAQPLAVRVVDIYANPVPGVAVIYAAPTHPGATLSSASATTGANGIASVLATADEIAGAYAVAVAVDGTAGATLSLANTPSAPHALAIIEGGAQRTLATTAFARPISVHVVDAFGNAVPRAIVDVTVPASGATATASARSLVTDAQGGASLTLVAGAVVGTFPVVIQAEGALTPATTTFEIQAIGTRTTATTNSAVAVDQVAHVTITVAADLGTPSGSVDLVDAAGSKVASATLIAGTALIDVDLTGLGLGTHVLTATFAAQGSYGASASSTVSFDASADSGSLSGGGTGCNAGGTTGAAGIVLVLALIAVMLPRRRAVVAVVAGLAAATTAHADPDAARAIDRFHAASPESAWFALDSASFTGDRKVSLSAVTDYAKHPLDIYDADGAVRDHVVTDSLIVQLGASVTLRDRFRLSATVPMAAWQAGNGGTYNGMDLPAPIYAFGDVTAAGDYRLVGLAGDALRVAAGVRFGAPTGSRTNFTSDGVFSVEPRLVVAGTQGRVEYAATASAFLRSESAMAGAMFGSELRYEGAVGVHAGKLLVGPELIGAMPLETGTAVGEPVELQLGAHYAESARVRFGVAGGYGVVNAAGEPRWRLLASLIWKLGER